MGVVKFLLLSLCLVVLTSPIMAEMDKSQWRHPNDMGPRRTKTATPTEPETAEAPGTPASMKDKLKMVKPKVGESGKRVGGAGSSGLSATPTSESQSMVGKMTEISACADVERQLDKCKRKLQQFEEGSEGRSQIEEGVASCLKSDASAPAPSSCEEKLFFQRFIRVLLNKFPSADTTYTATVQMRQEELQRLKRFTTDLPVALGDVDRALAAIVANVRERTEGEDDWVHHESDTLLPSLQEYYAALPPARDALILSMVSVTAAVVLWMLWRGLSKFQFISLLLVVSLAWHWMYMVKKAVVKKHVTLSADVPSECQPDAQKSWISYLSSSVFGAGNLKQCELYHEALLVDPVLEVSPIVALSDMLTLVVLQPVEHLGGTLGRFFNSLMGELSWASTPFILPFVFLCLLMVLIMVCGYEIRLPFFAGIRRAPQTPPQVAVQPLQATIANQSHEHMALELNQMKKELDEEKSRTAELEDVALAFARLQQERKDDRIKFLMYQLQKQEEQHKPDKDVQKTPTKNVGKNLLTSRVEILNTPEVQKSPAKKLVVRGDVTSPDNTLFEWVEENASTVDVVQRLIMDDDDLDGLEATEPVTLDDLDGLALGAEGGDDSFSKKVRNLFDKEGEGVAEGATVKLKDKTRLIQWTRKT